MSRAISAAVLAALALALAACGESVTAGGPAPDAPESTDGSQSPALGMCAEGVTDCVDVITEPAPDEFDVDSELDAARGMLGLAEDELSPDVRVARRGDEQMMLTEDYVLGRKTVELDADDAGVYRVVSVLVELPEGPETVTD